MPSCGEAAAVAFAVGGQTFAVPSLHVLEVVEKPRLAPVPLAPPWMLGVGNLRGRVLPVIALSSAAEQAGAARVLVLERPAFLGILVDGLPWLARGQDFAAPALPAFLARAPAPATTNAGAAGSPKAASPPPPAEADRRFVCFDAGDQVYALPIEDVREVAALPKHLSRALAPAEHGPDAAMMGAAAWRGGVLPIISLRAVLGLPASSPAPRHMVVVALGAHVFAVAVDHLRPVLRVPPDAIGPVPPVLSRGRGEARLHGICRTGQGGLVSVLSPGGLFDAQTEARLLAISPQDSAPASPPDQQAAKTYLAVRLDDQIFALPAACVEEVVRRPPAVARLPQEPDFVLGLMNLRGQALPVIDPRRRFGGTGPAGRLVVVISLQARRIGVCVDAVPGFLQELPASQNLVADTGSLIDRIACMGPGGRTVMLLDAGALLNDVARALAS